LRSKAGPSSHIAGVYLAGDRLRLTHTKEGPGVTTTMTWVGLEVHARSTEAAAIDVTSGELTLRRFDTGQRVADWLCTLPQPVHALRGWTEPASACTA
jgi:hypothetical protein